MRLSGHPGRRNFSATPAEAKLAGNMLTAEAVGTNGTLRIEAEGGLLRVDFLPPEPASDSIETTASTGSRG